MSNLRRKLAAAGRDRRDRDPARPRLPASRRGMTDTPPRHAALAAGARHDRAGARDRRARRALRVPPRRMARLQARARDGDPRRAGRRSARARADHLQDSTATAERARRDGLRWMLTAVAVSFVPAAGLAWLVAGKVLRPVEQVADVVDRVDGTETAERVELGTRDDELGRLATGVDHMLDRLDARRDEQRELLHEVVHELRTPLAVATTNLELASSDPALEGETATQVAASAARDRPHGPHGRRSVGARSPLAARRGHLDRPREGSACVREPSTRRPLRHEVCASRSSPRHRCRWPSTGPRSGPRSATCSRTRCASRRRGRRSRSAAVSASGGPGSRCATRGRASSPPSSPSCSSATGKAATRATDAAIAPADPDAAHGIGLTIARQLVEAQGGQLTLQSEPGVGSTFVVWLPADPDAALDRRRRSGRRPPPRGPLAAPDTGLTLPLSPNSYGRRSPNPSEEPPCPHRKTTSSIARSRRTAAGASCPPRRRVGVPLPPPAPTTETLFATPAQPDGRPGKTKRGRRVLAACVGAAVGAAAVAGVFAVATRDNSSNSERRRGPSLAHPRRTTPSRCSRS